MSSNDKAMVYHAMSASTSVLMTGSAPAGQPLYWGQELGHLVAVTAYPASDKYGMDHFTKAYQDRYGTGESEIYELIGKMVKDPEAKERLKQYLKLTDSKQEFLSLSDERAIQL